MKDHNLSIWHGQKMSVSGVDAISCPTMSLYLVIPRSSVCVCRQYLLFSSPFHPHTTLPGDTGFLHLYLGTSVYVMNKRGWGKAEMLLQISDSWGLQSLSSQYQPPQLAWTKLVKTTLNLEITVHRSYSNSPAVSFTWKIAQLFTWNCANSSIVLGLSGIHLSRCLSYETAQN